jgi:hypothetical protein
MVLGGAELPRLYHRIWLTLPSAQDQQWKLALDEKKREFAKPWSDTRPLIIMAGDSQVEYGRWYELFGGAFAICNCGLSRAKIGDVANLVVAINDRNPEKVVLMCGVNNLSGGDSVQSCINDYKQLISTSRSSLHPRNIIALSVMPVRQSKLDESTRKINRQILAFNQQLENACPGLQVRFVDLSAAVADDQGGLSAELTQDGLHLNPAGYEKIAAVIAPILARSD